MQAQRPLACSMERRKVATYRGVPQKAAIYTADAALLAGSSHRTWDAGSGADTPRLAR